ncbi:hypothetical protein [Roseibium polysiphoniae]|uniref:Replication protein n=1 Tax=Roseibium polysiphoniae TaxID=2571221 RepID=A0ABR9CC53_9HYPH|nr:hypothetical protein [Roseibium polysiphoniae]MBD8876665.1 hypothetical protein [Roseibium polysiphoniae]
MGPLHSSNRRQKLINAGWLTRVENIRPDGGDCSHGYIIHREKGLCSDRPDSLSTSGTVDTVKTALPAEPDRQGVPVQGGTYKINPSRPNNKKTDNKDTRDYLDIASPEPPIAASTKNGLAKDSHVHTADARDYIERVRSELLMFGLNPDAPHMVGGVNAVIAWYACGADIDRDVLPTIEMVLSRAKTAPFSLAYFTKAIVNAVEARKAAERRVEEQTRKSEQKHTNPKSKFAGSVARVAGTGATQSAEPIQTQPSRKKPIQQSSGLNLDKWLEGLDTRRRRRQDPE